MLCTGRFFFERIKTFLYYRFISVTLYIEMIFCEIELNGFSFYTESLRIQ
jgi:hypothetical protein